MRLTEFRVLLEESTKFYTIGDSHAVMVAKMGGRDWTNLAIGGKSSTDSGMLANIDKIPKGATVLVSQGANDTANAMLSAFKNKKPPKDPKIIAANVANVVSKVQAQGANVIFMLFPNGPGRGPKGSGAEWYGGDYQEEVRNAIKSAISVPIIDINGKPLYDGIHAGSSTYKEVANQVRSMARSSTRQNNRPAQQDNKSAQQDNKPTQQNATQDNTAQKEFELSDLLQGMVKNWLSGGKTPVLPAAGLGALGIGAANNSTRSDTGAGLMQRAVDARRAGQSSDSGQARTPAANTSRVTRNTVSPEDIKSYILSKGLSKNHAAGMLANIRAESSFNSAAYNPNDNGKGRSIGLFQHHASRANNLEQRVPDWRTNWKGQIDFALSEPAGQRYSSMSFRTPEEAARWFTINFERPANMVVAANTRAKHASQYA